MATLIGIPILALSVRALLEFQLGLADSRGFIHPTLIWSCLLLLIAGPFGILLHELGHFLAGIGAGQYCRAIVVGPLQFARSGHGWRMRWIPLRSARSQGESRRGHLPRSEQVSGLLTALR